MIFRTLFVPKPLRIRLDEIVEFIRIFDRTRYSVLFCPEKYDTISHMIR